MSHLANINYDNKTFVSVRNSKTGEVSSETFFNYHQKDNLVWAEYAGGAIRFGTLIVKCDGGGNLKMCCQYLNENGELMTGECFSTPEIPADGRIRLHEKWHWTGGNLSSGESIIE